MNPAILLVDVPSANREGLKHFLQCQKCDVEEASDGESAVRFCSEMQPDLVLLFDSLPDIGSFETLPSDQERSSQSAHARRSGETFP